MDYGLIMIVTVIGVIKHFLMLYLSIHLCNGKISKDNIVRMIVWAGLLSMIETVLSEVTLDRHVYFIQLLGYGLYGYVLYMHTQRTFFYGLSMSFLVRSCRLPIAILINWLVIQTGVDAEMSTLLTMLSMSVFLLGWLIAFKLLELRRLKHHVDMFNAMAYVYVNVFYISVGVAIPYIASVIIEKKISLMSYVATIQLSVSGLLIVFIVVLIGLQKSFSDKTKTIKTYLETHGYFMRAYHRYMSEAEFSNQQGLKSETIDELKKIDLPYLKGFLFEKVLSQHENGEEVTVELNDMTVFKTKPDRLIEWLRFAFDQAEGDLVISLDFKEKHHLTLTSSDFRQAKRKLRRNNQIIYDMKATKKGYVQVISFV